MKKELPDSEQIHDTLEAVADDLRDLGLEGTGPWRSMAWIAFDHIRAESCAACGRADLLRLRGMIDTHLADLGGERAN